MKNEQLFTIFFFFVSILIILLLVFPQYQNWSFLKQRVDELKIELQNQENYFEEIKKIAVNLEKYKDPLSKIDSALPSNPSIPELFHLIKNFSSTSGLLLAKIGSISTTPLPNSRLKETRTTINLEGDYSALKNFLSALEKSARLIEVENISFSTPQEKEKNPFEFNLKIKVYSY